MVCVNPNRLLLQTINLLTNQPINSCFSSAELRFYTRACTNPTQILLEQAENKQPEISAASSIPIFFIGMYREGIVKDNDAVDSYVSSALLHFNKTQLLTAQQTLWSV